MYFLKQQKVIEDLHSAEREFGELITERWDIVSKSTKLQKKAMIGAKRIKELRFILATHKLLPNTVQ